MTTKTTAVCHTHAHTHITQYNSAEPEDQTTGRNQLYSPNKTEGKNTKKNRR